MHRQVLRAPFFGSMPNPLSQNSPQAATLGNVFDQRYDTVDITVIQVDVDLASFRRFDGESYQVSHSQTGRLYDQAALGRGVAVGYLTNKQRNTRRDQQSHSGG